MRSSRRGSPGGTPLGEAIREVVLHGLEMTAWAEATLFASARAEHVARVIRPALERGAWVVCDRYVDSSLVYQGIARRPRHRGGARAQPRRHRRAAAGADLRARARCRRRPRVARAAELDRIEREDDELPRLPSPNGYRELGRLFPERVVDPRRQRGPGCDRGAGS